MSDMTFIVHARSCDWPGCDQTTDDICDGDWLHTEDERDYCPEHWHIDDDLDERVPGPDLEDSKNLEEQT